MVKRLGQFLSVITWLLVTGSIVIIMGGLLGRPLLVAAVPTGSMVPVLNPGDLIVVLPTWTVASPGLGDIVVYKTPQDQEWIVHRIIVGNQVEGFVTKGDANPVPDPHRVMPGDIGGVVPQWSGGALHLPRLGILSQEQGPLSSPIVAGVALVMGVYLLLLDVKSPRGLKHALRRKQRATPVAVFSLYLGLAGSAFLTTILPAWTLSTRQFSTYEVVTEHPVNSTAGSQYLLGQPHIESVPISNPSPLPLVIVFNASDASVHYTPGWALIPGGAAETFQAVVETPEVGKHTSVLRMGVFLPLLPPFLLALLAQQSVALAAVATALVPAALILAISLLDVRCRTALGQWRMKMSLRFGF